MEITLPLLEGSGMEKLGKIVLGTVKDDIHDIDEEMMRKL